MPERDTTRINERIRVPEVRVVDENGEQVGILPTDKALRMAQDRDLDLVEVAPDSRPPVCRILDYSKYKYEQAQKQKAARKHQTQIVLREIKFRPKIAEHDYATKKGHVERFLLHKDKVKLTIMFRGREQTHPELGQKILERVAGELEEIAVVDQRPQQDGRNMTMLLSPAKEVLSGQITADIWKERQAARAAGEDVEELSEDAITVDGPGEEPTPIPPAKPRPERERSQKAKPKREPKPEAAVEADAPEAAASEPADAELPAAAEPEPEPIAEEEPQVAPEPEPEPEKPKPKPKPKPKGPAPLSKAEMAALRKPKPKLNLGTGAARPGSEPEGEEAKGKPAASKDAAKAAKKAPAKKAPAKKAAKKAPAKKAAKPAAEDQ